MLLGLLLFTLCLLLQAYTIWSSLAQSDSLGTILLIERWRVWLAAGAVVLGLLHAAGLFSISFILAEGHMVCFLVAIFALLLLVAAVAARLQQSPAGVECHARYDSCCSTDSIGACNKLHILAPVAARTNGQYGKNIISARPAKEEHDFSTVGQSKPSNLQIEKRLPHQMRRNQQCLHIVLWGAGLLACNALMGSIGLVVRTGHDAMHKAAPMQATAQPGYTGAHSLPDLVLSDVGNWAVHAVASAQWLSAAIVQTQDLLAPLVCVMIFPFVLLHATTSSPASTVKGQRGIERLQGLTVQSVWFSYFVLALYWVIVQTGQAGASLSFILKHALSAFNLYLGESTAQIFFDVASYASSHVIVISRCLHQPVQVLMPRIVFLTSALSFAALLVSEARERRQPRIAVRHGAGSKASTCVAALAAPLLLVCGPEQGLVCALCLLECTCVVKLLQYLQPCDFPSSSSVGAAATNLTISPQESWVGIAEGCLWALLSMQLFFCSGRFCEFAGLQYAAGNHPFHFMLDLQSLESFLHTDMCPRHVAEASGKNCCTVCSHIAGTFLVNRHPSWSGFAM